MKYASWLILLLLIAPLSYAAGPDPLRPEQWYLADTRQDAACPQGCGSTEIVIAILDTGVDTDHEDLAPILLAGYNVFNDSAWVQDPVQPAGGFRVGEPSQPTSKSGAGHGTQTAGVAAAITNNARGIAGFARASVIPVVVATNDPDDGIAAENVAEGIEWLLRPGGQRPHVISMSLHVTHGDVPRLDAALDAAYAAGIVLVAAAGNNNPLPGGGGEGACLRELTYYPASHPAVIAVAGTTQQGGVSPLSNWGPEVDIAAPMHSIVTTQSDKNGSDRYVVTDGTSFATPQVAAAAAILMDRVPGITPAQVKDHLVQGSTPIVRDGTHACPGSPTMLDPLMHFPKLDMVGVLHRVGWPATP